MRILCALALFFLSTIVARAASGSTTDGATTWPNEISRANGDRWLIENHDRLREMRPRVLVVNFSNRRSREQLEHLVQSLTAALAEGSRYHGYADAKAPAFLRYEIFKFVDLRDGRTNANGAAVPFKPGQTSGFNIDYNAFFGDDFAKRYGVRDPKDASRFLRLDELVEAGDVHELWFTAEHVDGFGAYESVELKPKYDEQFRPLSGKHVQAGNGGDPDQRWTGRSIRIGFINASRGIGCFMESLSHSIEGMATSGAIPYFSKYFKEFAGYDLRRRWGLPFGSLYALKYDGKKIEYPNEHTAIIRPGDGREFTITNYFVIGGNAHWPPNARGHYDLENTNPVLSTIATWRTARASDDGRDAGNGRGDLREPFTNTAFARYRKLAPDCMGAWLIYWRQNFPGLENRQLDDDGKPMKNWWPFLFY